MIRHLILLKIGNITDVKGVLLQWFIIYLIKKFALLADKYASGNEIKKENISNQELVAEFQKTIIKKF